MHADLQQQASSSGMAATSQASISRRGVKRRQENSRRHIVPGEGSGGRKKMKVEVKNEPAQVEERSMKEEPEEWRVLSAVAEEVNVEGEGREEEN